MAQLVGAARALADGTMVAGTVVATVVATVTYRVLVTGSRVWTNYQVIVKALDEVLAVNPDMVLVHGHCPWGADRLADLWAARRGVPAERHPADWKTHGRRAGILRNQHMVDTRPDACLAFIVDNSPGATHCANAAREAGIPTAYLFESTSDSEETAP